MATFARARPLLVTLLCLASLLGTAHAWPGTFTYVPEPAADALNPTTCGHAGLTAEGERCDPRWTAAPHDTWGSAIHVSPDGATLYMTPKSSRSTGVLAVALDAATGSERWRAPVDGSAFTLTSPQASVLSPDSSLLYLLGTGRQNGTTLSAAYLQALRTGDGSSAWLVPQPLGGPGTFFPNALTLSPDGATLYAAGAQYWTGSSWERYGTSRVGAFDAATGAPLWTATLPQVPGASATTMRLAADPTGGRVYVLRDGEWDGDLRVVSLMALAAGNGAIEWASALGGTEWDRAYAGDLAVSPDGSRLFVAGRYWHDHEENPAGIWAHDARNGSVLWGLSDFGADRDAWIRDLAVSPNGATLIALGTDYPYYSYDGVFLTLGLDAATGHTRWTARDGHDHDMTEGHSLALSVDGLVAYALGEDGRREWDSDVAVYAYNTLTGAPLQAFRYDASPYDHAVALAPAPDGKSLYVAGYAQGGESPGLRLAAYDTLL